MNKPKPLPPIKIEYATLFDGNNISEGYITALKRLIGYYADDNIDITVELFDKIEQFRMDNSY